MDHTSTARDKYLFELTKSRNNPLTLSQCWMSQRSTTCDANVAADFSKSDLSDCRYLTTTFTTPTLVMPISFKSSLSKSKRTSPEISCCYHYVSDTHTHTHTHTQTLSLSLSHLIIFDNLCHFVLLIRFLYCLILSLLFLSISFSGLP